MLALATLWLLSPFATGALLGSSPRLKMLAGRHYALLRSVGFLGILLVALGAFVLPRPLALVALALGGPLSGCSLWVRRIDGDDGGPDDDDDDPEPPPPGDDWDRIVEEFERHVNRWSPGPAGPAPSGSPEPALPISPALV